MSLLFNMRRILYILALALSIAACTEEIDKSNRYTFTGETVADFMLNRSEKYSHFITLLKRAELFSLLQTYGQYTLFLPNNEAVEKYIQEQDSIYHATKESDDPVWTGVTSPLIEDLSDSMINVIARTHLVEGNYQTAAFDDGALPRWNYNDRYLGVSYESTKESFYIKINNCAAIISSDNMVENGVVHIIDNVIEETNNHLPTHIAKYSFFSIFSAALSETGFCDSLLQYMEQNFQPIDVEDAPMYIEFNVKKKFYKYTGFIETDEVFNANGIYTLDDLKSFAEKWYGTEDKDNYKSPRNALYKFVAYHFVPRELTYNKVVPTMVDGFPREEILVSGHDWYDYIETMLGKLMKVVKPLSTTDGAWVYINRPIEGQIYNNEMRKHLNVRLIEPTEFTQLKEEYSGFNPLAMNGVIQPMDKILVYDDDEMVGNILNERLRIDFATLLPELSCNNLRHTTAGYMPFNYSKNIASNAIDANYFSYITSRHYMGDVVRCHKNFNTSFRLPPLPQRTYEIRLSITSVPSNNFQSGDCVLQPYIDGKVCSLPIDTRIPYNDPMIGWQNDSETLDNGVDLDKQMRNRGYMKGPDSFYTRNYNSGSILTSRNNHQTLRKIITKIHLTEGEHWIRFRNLNENCSYFDFDYIEFVPLPIINNPLKPEDRH